MSEPAIINSTGIFKGQIENGVQYYHVTGEDADGDKVIIIFGCKTNFSDAIDTSFRRLFPVRFKAADPVAGFDKPIIDITPEGEPTNGTAAREN